MAKSNDNDSDRGSRSRSNEEILDLVTGSDRGKRRVSIDGKIYDMKPPGSLRALRPVMRAAEILYKILAADDVTAEMEASFTDLSLAALRVILPKAPATIVAKLPDTERMRLLVFFLETMPGLGALPTSIRKSRSQQGSNVSTAAVRAIG